MKQAYNKNTVRSILKSLGRYFAILTIIALGVGFFSGLKATRPDMIYTAEKYVYDNKLFDYRLLTTIGFSKEDIQKISELDYTDIVEGALNKDFLYVNEDGEERIYRAHSITDDINCLQVTSGRLPEKSNECVIDGRYLSDEIIGTEMKIADENDDKTKKFFKYDTYKIVGLVNSSYYMNMERGTTSLGNGQVDAFMYINESGFKFEYYTECFLTLKGDEKSFSDEYTKKLLRYESICLDDCEKIIGDRYQTLINDANKEIDDTKTELEKKKEDALGELQDSRKTLDDSAKQISNAKTKLIISKNELENGEDEIEATETKIEENSATLQTTKITLDDSLIKIQQSEGTIASSEALLQSKKVELDAAGDELADNQVVLDGKRFELEMGRLEIEDDKTQLESLLILQAAGDTQYDDTIVNLQTTISEGEAKLLQGENAYNTALFEYNVADLEYKAGKSEYDTQVSKLNSSKTELTAAKTQYEDGLSKYNLGIVELENARIALENAKKQLETSRTQIEDAQQKLQENQDSLAEGEEKYAKGLAEYNDSIVDGKKKIMDAEEELKKVEAPEYFALSRETNIGYSCFDSDSSIVEGIAKVFPIFFFLIAALVCSTTMTRMVDDERTQIGTLRALGYSNFMIMNKYIIYSGSAAIVGCVSGFFLGTYLFPKTIWKAYGMLYGFSELEYTFSPLLLGISAVVALLCSVGTTCFACRRELIDTPAELIRQKAPAAGKRILLERVGFLWKNMKFLYKVSARNIFRFKKRMIMMIVGIAGCMALVLTGFGLNDSISNIVNNQFSNIMKMDANITFSDEVTDEAIKLFSTDYVDEISDYALIRQNSVEADIDGSKKSVYLISSEDNNTTDFVDLHMKDKKIKYPQRGCTVISEKIADMMGVEVGDKATFIYDDNKEMTLKVTGIFENYVYNYAYISAKTYEDIYEENYVPKTVYLNFNDNIDEFKITAKLANIEGVISVNVMNELRKRVDNSMKSLDYVVWLVIGCAGALAFIVLFNLSNINITERVREIATIQVLGFFSKEVRAYVFRENIVLTIMGIICGIPLGVWLHGFVMEQINIDIVTFQVQILPLSFILGVVVVIGFTVIVEFVMKRKLSRINMAEALKSVE